MNQVARARAAIAEAMRPGHFFAAPGMHLDWEHVPAEETAWEVYRGQLVPPHLTRETAVFESWHVYLTQDRERSTVPLLSVLLDAERGQVHIVRGLYCWTWEGYHSGDNVYLSREVPRWTRELVGSVDLATCSERADLPLWIFRAVVGLSRLPLTSVEAPLPGFSLGLLAYFWNKDAPRPLTTWQELLAAGDTAWSPMVRTKWLEFLLRTTPATDIDALATAYAQQHGPDETLRLLRAVFNDVALSPYTDFVDKTLHFLRRLVEHGHLTIEQHVDFLSHLLRQLARHLTAYDLVTFHHRGANYPDALLLDAALKQYLRLIESQPALFAGATRPARLRRRALRQAWRQRRHYEEHPVPDAPTSPGENRRILPPPHVRVPDEQIENLGKRRKHLYHADPLGAYASPAVQRVLEECGRDLQCAEEVHELGMAVFIERPCGTSKAPGEPDLSPLLAHDAFSRSLAERALAELARERLLRLSPHDVATCRALLSETWPAGGIPASALPTLPPRVVSLADAAKAAADFVIVRTLPGSRRAMAAWLAQRGISLDTRACLIVGGATATGKPAICICDDGGQSLAVIEAEGL
jgi:hypothetical protein